MSYIIYFLLQLLLMTVLTAAFQPIINLSMQKKHKMMSRTSSCRNSKEKLCHDIIPIDKSGRHNYIGSVSLSTASAISILATTTIPIIANAESTISAPIGEMVDGSATSTGSSFGQWFFLLYVVVSLLAGGKEMVKRIQNQMDKDSD